MAAAIPQEISACARCRRWSLQRRELLGEEHVLGRPDRVQQSEFGVVCRVLTRRSHRKQRDDTRSAGDELDRGPVGVCGVPDEVSAQRAVQLELVAFGELVHQVWRDFACWDFIDRQDDASRLARRRDRVGPGRLIAVRGGEADVEVGTGVVSGPGRHVQLDADRGLGLATAAGDASDVPARPDRRRHQYRSSCHGSPRMWYPFCSQNPGSSVGFIRISLTHLALFQK